MQNDTQLIEVYGACEVCGGPRGTWLLQGLTCVRHPEHGPDVQQPQPLLRIPPAAELGEVAYQQFCFQMAPVSWMEDWATWKQLDDETRQAWAHVGRVIAEKVRAANERG